MTDSSARRPRIGALLVESGALAPERLAEALRAQSDTATRLGELMVRRGWVPPQAVARAAATQAGAPEVDLAAAPPDPALADPALLELCLRRRSLPWRRVSGRTIWAAADHGSGLAALAELGLAEAEAGVAIADPAEIDAAILEAFGPVLARRAATRAPLALSARARTTIAQRIGLATAVAALAAAFVAAPSQALGAVFAALVALNALNAAARIAVLATALRAPSDLAPAPGAASLGRRRPPPRVTLLVPLLREPETLPLLFEALERLDWPRELLDVKLLIEADDATTRAALTALPPPPFAQVLIVPPGAPRTKPRALNAALDFADGEIVGIYDAEDRPEPDQLRRAVEILRASPPEVACVQCRLGYYNTTENWLTRCFTLEYMIWFDVMLRGFRDLRLPIPLGGTSVFFRRAALNRLGGWDAHNVTEDADLGMRLARLGYRCEVSVSTTYEEANGRLLPWIRQRSRWLKGYATTWLVHMRAPVRLWRELGTLGFIGFQTIFLGALVAYFGLPLFWAVWGATALGRGPEWLEHAPLWAFGALATVQLSGWIAMVAAAAIATARRRQLWLLTWVPTLALYWPLGSVAALLAIAEMIVAPAYWRKTRHGVGRIAAAERAAALSRRATAPDVADVRAAV